MKVLNQTQDFDTHCVARNCVVKSRVVKKSVAKKISHGAIQTTVALLAIFFTSSSVADERYICLFGNSERAIKVVYTDPESKVPCEVVYEKDADSQVLWNAQNLEGYCETKAAEFVEKQRSWGWDCAKMEEAQAELPETAQPEVEEELTQAEEELTQVETLAETRQVELADTALNDE